MTTHESSLPAPASPPLREIISDALRYWEPRRLVYNAVLAAIVAYSYFAQLPNSRDFLSFAGAVDLFVLAILANVCYCAAYVVDVFVQLSVFRAKWRRGRWALLLLGLTLAATITLIATNGLIPFIPWA